MSFSFQQVQKRQTTFAKEVEQSTGVDKSLVLKILSYAQTLSSPDNPQVISQLVFKAQMAHRFSITSQFHLQLMYEAVQRRAAKPGIVGVNDYVKLLCMFYSDKLDLKIDFVFSSYDFDQSGYISMSELHVLLRTSVSGVDELQDEESDEPLKELTELVIQVMDRDKDGQISLEEFREYVKRNILFIQLLGQVLPMESEMEKFMSSLKRMREGRVKEYFRLERFRCLNDPIITHEHRFQKFYPVAIDFVDFVC